jgi:hypothetical protein
MKFKKLIVSSIIIFFFLTVFASANYFAYPPAYGGVSAYYRRYYFSPSSQQYYFGENWDSVLGGFGAKGTWSTTPVISGGAKSYTSSSTNLLTNTFISQGRNPNKISNTDPNFRGYNILDQPIILESYNLEFQERNDFLVIPKATARLISQYGPFGVGGRKDTPVSEVYLQVVDLPPLGSAERYQLWLFDEESGHRQSLGLFYVGIGGSGQVRVKVLRPIDMYDFIVITLEPYPDFDPNPGKIIMIGAIDPIRKLNVAKFINTLT